MLQWWKGTEVVLGQEVGTFLSPGGLEKLPDLAWNTLAPSGRAGGQVTLPPHSSLIGPLCPGRPRERMCLVAGVLSSWVYVEEWAPVTFTLSLGARGHAKDLLPLLLCPSPASWGTVTLKTCL